MMDWVNDFGKFVADRRAYARAAATARGDAYRAMKSEERWEWINAAISRTNNALIKEQLINAGKQCDGEALGWEWRGMLGTDITDRVSDVRRDDPDAPDFLLLELLIERASPDLAARFRALANIPAMPERRSYQFYPHS